MNTVTLKQAAEKLVKKVNALGFTKNGAPMVVDQAYELVAAIKGYRNQHALRASLAKVSQGPAAATAIGWSNLIAAQGWSAEKQIELYEQFLGSHGLADSFIRFAKSVAATEETPADAMTTDLIDLLKSLHISVLRSGRGLPYWSCENQALEFAGFISQDFETEDQAWLDAWRHLQSEVPGASFAAEQARQGNPEPLTRWIRCMRADHSLRSTAQAIEALEVTWGEEHSFYTRQDWREDVAQGNTKLGYWEWVHHAIESHDGEDEHCSECGTPLDMDGYDGLCGNCADAQEESSSCPEVDLSSVTAYSFSIGALTRDQLEDELVDRWGGACEDLRGLSTDSVRAELIDHYYKARHQAADQAMAQHRFLSKVLRRGGWSWEPSGAEVRCVVFLQPERPEIDEARVVLCVHFDGMTVTRTHVLEG